MRMTSRPPFPSLSWRGGFNPVFLLCCAIIVATNWVVPTGWIENSPAAMEWAELVRGLLLKVSPYADIWAHARTTVFPKVALFSHAVTWTLMIALTLYDFLLVGLNSRSWVRFWIQAVWRPADAKKRAVIVGSGLFVVAIAWVATMMPGNLTHIASADLRSRVVLGLLSACVFTLWHFTAFTLAVMFFALLYPTERNAS